MQGETSLLLASQEGFLEVVSILLSNGSQAINKASVDGRTPLQLWRFWDAGGLLTLAGDADQKALVEGSEIIEVTGTAADVACHFGHTEVLETLAT